MKRFGFKSVRFFRFNSELFDDSLQMFFLKLPFFYESITELLSKNGSESDVRCCLLVFDKGRVVSFFGN